MSVLHFGCTQVLPVIHLPGESDRVRDAQLLLGVAESYPERHTGCLSFFFYYYRNKYSDKKQEGKFILIHGLR